MIGDEENKGVSASWLLKRTPDRQLMALGIIPTKALVRNWMLTAQAEDEQAGEAKENIIHLPSYTSRNAGPHGPLSRDQARTNPPSPWVQQVPAGANTAGGGNVGATARYP